MERRVAAGVPAVHVGSVCQQVLQVMNQAVATGLRRIEAESEQIEWKPSLFSPEVGSISVFVKGVAKLQRFPITECPLN